MIWMRLHHRHQIIENLLVCILIVCCNTAVVVIIEWKWRTILQNIIQVYTNNCQRRVLSLNWKVGNFKVRLDIIKWNQILCSRNGNGSVTHWDSLVTVIIKKSPQGHRKLEKEMGKLTTSWTENRRRLKIVWCCAIMSEACVAQGIIDKAVKNEFRCFIKYTGVPIRYTMQHTHWQFFLGFCSKSDTLTAWLAICQCVWLSSSTIG